MWIGVVKGSKLFGHYCTCKPLVFVNKSSQSGKTIQHPAIISPFPFSFPTCSSFHLVRSEQTDLYRNALTDTRFSPIDVYTG